MIKQNLQHNENYQLPAEDSYPDEIKDGYQLNWVGKNYAKYAAGLKPAAVLEPDTEHNALNENKLSRNVYITGDNLEVLKHLQNAYAGKVDMIYIDPPYNTGKEFVYHDEFHFSDAELAEKIGLDEKEIARVRQLNGRSSHSAWLTFIYPRLKIAARLLKPTGVIFISIDDNEQAQLKLLCDEVFGDGNFVYMLSVVNKLNGNDNSSGMIETEEYCLIYAKNKDSFAIGVLPIDDEDTEEWNEDELGFWKLGGGLKATGEASTREHRPNLFFPLYINEKDLSFSLERTNLHTFELFPITDGQEMRWYWRREKFLQDANEVIVKRVGNSYSIYKKQRPQLGDLPSKRGKTTFYHPKYSTANSNKDIKELFGSRVFDYSKSVFLVKDFLSLSAASVSSSSAADLSANAGKCQEDLSAVRERIRRKFEDMAAVLKKIPFTPANFRVLFGRSGTVNTPLGNVTIGKNQFEKLRTNKREELLQAMYDTLTDPIIVIKEQRQGKNPDNLFVKSFIKDENDAFITVMSVVAKIDGIDVSISTYQRRTYEVMQKINTPADIIYEKQHRQEVVPGGNGDKPLTLSDDNRLNQLSANAGKSQEGNFCSETVEEVRERLRRKFADNTVPLVRISFTQEKFDELFPNLCVETPAGTVKLGEHQNEKLREKGRDDLLLAMYQTLTEPIAVMRTSHQQGIVLSFAKSFTENDKDRTLVSVVVERDGIKVSITTHMRELNNILNKIEKPEDVIWETSSGNISGYVYDRNGSGEVAAATLPNAGTGAGGLETGDRDRSSSLALSANSGKSQEGNSPLVLDFFSGSGTTAHAVMQFNAENAGKTGGSPIRYILVQLPEKTPENSEARKAGYETIDQIGMERIKRAAKKITAATPAGLFNAAAPDFGFLHFTCKTVDAQTLDKFDDFDEAKRAADFIGVDEDMVAPFGLETILRTWLTDDGLELTENAAEWKLGNYTAYYSEKLAKLYLIDTDETWDNESLKALLNAAGKNELTVKTLVIYAYSFSFRKLRELKTNLDTLGEKKPAVQERY